MRVLITKSYVWNMAVQITWLIKKVFEMGEIYKPRQLYIKQNTGKISRKYTVYITTQLSLIHPQSLQWICVIFGLDWHAIEAYMILIKAINTNCGRLNSEGVWGFRQIEVEWISLNIVFSFKNVSHLND